MGTMCHVKAVEGTRRDNATDLIKVIIFSKDVEFKKNHLLTKWLSNDNNLLSPFRTRTW